MSFYKPSSGNRIKPESKHSVVDKNYYISRSWLLRKPKAAQEVKDCTARKPVIEEGDKQGEGGREGVVVEARRSVSHVETNLASVASFLQVKVLVSDMPGFMQVHAFRCGRRTYDSLEKFSAKHMAYNMKKVCFSFMDFLLVKKNHYYLCSGNHCSYILAFFVFS